MGPLAVNTGCALPFPDGRHRVVSTNCKNGATSILLTLTRHKTLPDTLHALLLCIPWHGGVGACWAHAQRWCCLGIPSDQKHEACQAPPATGSPAPPTQPQADRAHGMLFGSCPSLLQPSLPSTVTTYRSRHTDPRPAAGALPCGTNCPPGTATGAMW